MSKIENQKDLSICLDYHNDYRSFKAEILSDTNFLLETTIHSGRNIKHFKILEGLYALNSIDYLKRDITDNRELYEIALSDHCISVKKNCFHHLYLFDKFNKQAYQKTLIEIKNTDRTIEEYLKNVNGWI